MWRAVKHQEVVERCDLDGLCDGAERLDRDFGLQGVLLTALLPISAGALRNVQVSDLHCPASRRIFTRNQATNCALANTALLRDDTNHHRHFSLPGESALHASTLTRKRAS